MQNLILSRMNVISLINELIKPQPSKAGILALSLNRKYGSVESTQLSSRVLQAVHASTHPADSSGAEQVRYSRRRNWITIDTVVITRPSLDSGINSIRGK